MAVASAWHDDARRCKEGQHPEQDFGKWMAERIEAARDDPDELRRIRFAASLALAEALQIVGRAA